MIGNASTLRRLANERKRLNGKIQNGDLNVVILDDGSDLTVMKVQIKGAEKSIYEGVVFNLCINFPKEYPNVPPNVFFSTSIWNCNISYETGAVCLETLKSEWKISVSIETIIFSICSILLYPNPDSAFHDYIGGQYKNNKSTYDETARYWTKFYAGGSGTFPEFEDKVARLSAEGFTKYKSLEKLSICSWDLDKARSMLIRELSESL